MSVEKCYDILQVMQASNSNNSDNFAERLRWFRNSSEMGQAELGKLVDRKASTISDWEKGKTEPSLREIEIMAAALNVSPARLAFGDLSLSTATEVRPSSDLADQIRAVTESIIRAANGDPGRLGWIREQAHLHLSPPAHWLSSSVGGLTPKVAEILEHAKNIPKNIGQKKNIGHGS